MGQNNKTSTISCERLRQSEQEQGVSVARKRRQTCQFVEVVEKNGA